MMKIRRILLLLFFAGLLLNGCDTSTRPSVAEDLTALFTIDKRSYETGDTVVFLNKSTGYSSVQWDLGDGTTSSARSPKHIYKAPGDYFPELTVSRSAQNETFRMKVTITGQPIVEVTSSTQGLEEAGDGGASEDAETDAETGAGADTEKAADDAADEIIAEDEQVHQYTINLDRQVAATGTRINFRTDTQDTVTWNLDENKLYTGVNGSVSYKTPGKKTLFLSLPGKQDTIAAATVQIFTSGTIPAKVLAGDPVTLKADGDLPMKWEIDDGRSISEKRTSISFDDAGTYTVRLLNESDNTTLYQSKITVEKPVVITPEDIDRMLNMLANAGMSMGEKDQVARDLRNYCVKGGNTEVGGKASGSLDEFIIKIRIEATRYVKVNIQCDLEYGKNQMVSKIIITGVTSTNV